MYNMHNMHLWRALTSDETILSCVSGYKIPFRENPVQGRVPSCIIGEHEWEAADREIRVLCEKGVLATSFHEQGEFISNFFLRPKKQSGKFRLICNLKALNEFVLNYHFKMENLTHVKNMITKECYMASIDLTEAYHSVPVHEDHRRYLKIQWKGQLFHYCSLPFGLSTGYFYQDPKTGSCKTEE